MKNGGIIRREGTEKMKEFREDVELGSSSTRLLEIQLLVCGKYWNDRLGK